VRGRDDRSTDSFNPEKHMQNYEKMASPSDYLFFQFSELIPLSVESWCIVHP